MPASRDQIYAALQKADAAGNTDDARALAQQYAAAAPEKGEIATAWDNLKGDVKTALAPATPNTPQRNGPMAPSLPLGDIVSHVVHGEPLPSGALPTDHLMHFLAGGDNGTGEVHQNTQGGQQSTAADRVSGDLVDLPISVARAGLRKLGLSHDDASLATNSAMMIAPALGPMARDAVGVGGDAARAAGTVLKPVGEIASAERRGKVMAGQMSAGAQAALKRQQAASAADAAAASAKAERLRNIAAKARQRGDEQFAQRADAAAQAVAPDPEIGTPRSLSEIGYTVRDPALANEDGINTRMRDMDNQLRSAMEQVAAEQEAKGVGVSDMPLAKELIKSSSDVVNPDPVNRPNVGNVPADSAGAKLHKMVLDALSPTYIPLDADMVGPVQAKGGRIIMQGTNAFRVIPPSLQNIDELRRTLGQAASGDLEGYGAINKIEARTLYGKVSDLMDEYAKGTSKEVQNNWRLGKKALEPYEKLKMGKTLVGLQNGTGISAVSPADIPGRLIAGGRDTIDQASMVAGPGPVQDALRSHIQNEFVGKNASQLSSMTALGTKLGDAIGSNGDLEAAVRQHIANVANAEQYGAKASELESRSATNMGRADKYSKIADQLTGKAAKSVDRVKEIERTVADLEIEDPKKVGSKYVSVLNDEHAAGRLSDQQYRDGISLAQKAETAFKQKATRDKWLGEASWLAGGGALGGTFGGPAGFAIGVGVGHVARTMRHSIGKRVGGL